MTSIGGPWDMSGIALVLNAGGVVRYLRVAGETFIHVTDPMQADVVVCACNDDIAESSWRTYSRHGVSSWSSVSANGARGLRY